MLGTISTVGETISIHGYNVIYIFAVYISGNDYTYRQGYAIPRSCLADGKSYEINFYTTGRQYIALSYISESDSLKLKGKDGGSVTGCMICGV